MLDMLIYIYLYIYITEQADTKYVQQSARIWEPGFTWYYRSLLLCYTDVFSLQYLTLFISDKNQYRNLPNGYLHKELICINKRDNLVMKISEFHYNTLTNNPALVHILTLGSVLGAYLFIGFPLRSIRNFVKFHLMKLKRANLIIV